MIHTPERTSQVAGVLWLTDESGVGFQNIFCQRPHVCGNNLKANAVSQGQDSTLENVGTGKLGDIRFARPCNAHSYPTTSRS